MMMYCVKIRMVKSLYQSHLNETCLEIKSFQPRKIAEINIAETGRRKPTSLGIIDVNLAFEETPERSPSSIIDETPSDYFEAVHYAPVLSLQSSVSFVPLSDSSDDSDFIPESNQRPYQLQAKRTIRFIDDRRSQFRHVQRQSHRHRSRRHHGNARGTDEYDRLLRKM